MIDAFWSTTPANTIDLVLWGRRLLVAVGIVSVLALEVGLLWKIGSTGDHMDPRCMQPNTECSR